MLELLVGLIKLPFVLLGAVLSLIFGLIGLVLSILGGILGLAWNLIVLGAVVLLVLWLLTRLCDSKRTVVVRH
jgi:hypothetical protein